MAGIKVNQAQWNAVDRETQQKIIEGMRRVGSLRGDETIVPADDVPAFKSDSALANLKSPMGGAMFQLRDPFRDAACDITAAAALAGCAGLSGPAFAACVAAVEAARSACKG